MTSGGEAVDRVVETHEFARSVAAALDFNLALGKPLRTDQDLPPGRWSVSS
jgi:hypothetical protein